MRFNRPMHRVLLLLVLYGAFAALLAGTMSLLPSGAGGRDAAGTTGRCGDRPTQAPRELRGMWLTTVTNIDWPSRPGLDAETVKAEYRSWLDVAQRYRLNAIFVQVRPSGDAFWPSEYAPWSEWLTGRRDGEDPGWDPLAFMVAEAHARNIEFHAWMNPYRGTEPATAGGPGADISKLAPDHPLRTHPDWAVAYPTGTKDSRFYFDPGVPAARRYVEDSMLDAVAKYDIDGIHFDDFFYPYPDGDQHEFDDARSFAAYGKGFANKADWRRENVNTLVREMDERIKAVKPWVKFGISPFGIWRNQRSDPHGSPTAGLQSYDAIYADTRKWVREGWLDYIVPQLYWYIGFEKADYAKLVAWWSDIVSGTKVQLYIGQADYRAGESGPWRDPGELDRQLSLNQKYEVAGSVHFSAKSIRADRLGAVSRYRDSHYAGPALIPVMSELPAHPPAAPEIMSVGKSKGGISVRWRPARDESPAAYAIYRVDGTVAKLVGSVHGAGTGVREWVDSTPGAGTGEYCVSGLDRSWNEGQASAPLAMRAS